MILNRRDFLRTISFMISPLIISRAPVQTGVTIQQMIDNASNNGYTFLTIPAGIYHIQETVQCAYNVSLDMSGVTLILDNDVDAIRCAPRANVRGGTIDGSGITWTHSGLLLDGVDRFDLTFQTVFENIQILGNWQTDGETGIGISMISVQGDVNNFIYGTSFNNISISYLHTGLLMKSTRTSGITTSCVNGNKFSNIIMNICRRSIRMEASDWDVSVDGNTFNNIHIQPNAMSEQALYCDGDTNIFNGLLIWDAGHYIKQPPEESLSAIELSEKSAYNQIQHNLYEGFTNSGIFNKFITPFL